jgi:hypothetical protein
MNEGVKILIERIKTHPEEFTEGSKWSHLIQSHKMFLSEEDAKALEDSLNGLMQQRFTERVMKELLAPQEDDDLGKWFTAQGKGTPLGGATRVGSSIGNVNAVHNGGLTLTTNGTGLVWESREPLDPLVQAQNNQLHELLHQKALKNLQTTPVKKHKTLFGKLFNYT